MKLSVVRLTSTVALLALTIWVGGLLALGAVVAPIVFASAPFQVAADAMTLVFSRFDRIAMGAAAVVIATEAVRARVTPRLRSGDVVRVLGSVLMAAMGAAEGVWVTPEIARLHAEGAARGVGEAGVALNAAHGLAEYLGKGQVLLALVVIALHVYTACSGDDAMAEAGSEEDD